VGDRVAQLIERAVDSGFRTPLLDFFRRGDVAHDIRLLAAQGALAPRAHEQLGLLLLLVGDQDPEIARTAEATLAAIPPDALAGFLARSDVAAEVRTFFAARGIEPAAAPTPPDPDTPIVDTGPEPEEPPPDEDEKTTLQRINAMNVAQRIALAMKGSREARAILIRDPNKIVGAAVLSSPKMTDSEIESIAKMASISDELLRIIAHTRAWMKRYGVVIALAKNPKTPVAISMNLLARLTDKDLRMLSTDRNVAEVVRTTARQKLVMDKK
jgi:hypothetical protein